MMMQPMCAGGLGGDRRAGEGCLHCADSQTHLGTRPEEQNAFLGSPGSGPLSAAPDGLPPLLCLLCCVLTPATSHQRCSPPRWVLLLIFLEYQCSVLSWASPSRLGLACFCGAPQPHACRPALCGKFPRLTSFTCVLTARA